MEALDIIDRSQITPISISDVAAQSGQLPMGIYKIYTTCDAYLKIVQTGNATTGLTTATAGDFLTEDSSDLYHVPENGRVGVIAPSGVTGTLNIFWAGRRSM